MTVATAPRLYSPSLSSDASGHRLPRILSAIAQTYADEKKIRRERLRLEILAKRHCYEAAEPESQIGFLKVNETRLDSSPLTDAEQRLVAEHDAFLEREIGYALQKAEEARARRRRKTPK